MEFSPTGLIGAVLVVAGLGAGAYAITGEQDFIVDIGRPLPEVYATFSGMRTFGSGLRAEGFDVPEITTSRPSAHELVFTAPAADPAQSARIAFTFSPGANAVTTRVTAAIDVPPVAMPGAGRSLYLSEDKIEEHFRQAIAELAEQMNSGTSTLAATNRLAVLLDTVAVASHPQVLLQMQARLARTNRRVDAIDARLQADDRARAQRQRDRDIDVPFGEPSDGRRRSWAERRGVY